MSAYVFTFVTRPDCNLCDDARPIVLKMVRRAGGKVQEVGVGSDDALLARFALRIPVVLTAEGKVLVEGEIKRKSLKRALTAHGRARS